MPARSRWRRGLVACGGVALLGAAGWALVANEHADRRSAETSPAPTSGFATDAVGMPAPGQTRTAAPADRPVAAPAAAPPTLATRMQAARDLRAFAAEARQHPAEGGLSYAMFALMLCRGSVAAERSAGLAPGDELPYASSEDSRAYAARAERRQRAHAACASFTPEELNASAQAELALLARQQADAVQSAVAGVSRSAQVAQVTAREAALRAVLERADPLLLTIALERAVRLDGTDGPYYVIDGRAVPMEMADGYRAALRVIPCRFGLVCDERSPDVLAACLVAAASCPTDRIELTRRTLADDERRDFDAALPRLEAAIRNRQAASFFR